jgi:hypothetical protein
MIKILSKLLLCYIPTVYSLLKANIINIMQKTNNNDNKRLYALISQSGSMMLTILTVLILLSLGSALVLMFGSSKFEQAYVNLGLRASYLAEAGYRYAASEYLNAGTLSEKVQRLQDLNSETVSFAGTEGSFSLKVYPHWFITSANHAAGSTTITTTVPGEFPSNFTLPATGKLKIGFSSYNYTGVVQTAPNSASFTIYSGLLEDISQNVHVYLVFNPPSAQTVNKDEDLTITSADDNINLFPARNGQFEVGGIRYFYKERKSGSVVLSEITSTQDSNFPLKVKTATDVVLKKQALIESTGAVGTVSSQINRSVSYNIPISDEIHDPDDTPETVPLSNAPGGQDTFANLNNWEVRDSQKTSIGDKIGSSHGIFSYYVTFQDLDETPDYQVAPTITYEWASSSLGNNTNVRGIWGKDSSNIYAVDEKGEIWKSDGSSWSRFATSSYKFYGISGLTSSGDFYVGGYLDDRLGIFFHFYGSTYDGWTLNRFKAYGVWAGSTSAVFIVGSSGKALRYDGDDNFTWLTSGTTRNLFGVWGASTKDVYAVGASGTIRHYNGSTWSGMTSGTSRNLRGIWGFSSTDIYAVGDSGTILHYDGSSWTSMTSGTSGNLYGVWGVSSSDAYAVGDSGTILHYDGSAWSSMDSGTSSRLYSVWGASSTDVYVGGASSTILHYTLTEEYTPIKYHILPLGINSNFSSEWSDSHGLLSYTVQTKQGWGYLLDYAVSGICFRWHDSTAYPSKEEGYGISLMYYSDATDPDDTDYDYIPGSIKPFVTTSLDRHDRPLIVLWKQFVVNGNEHRQWLAFKEVTGDTKFLGGQWKHDGMRFNDSSSLFLRIHEKEIDGTKVNDIYVFYGDASTIYTHTADSLNNNTNRDEYYPTYDGGEIRWPKWTLYPWYAADDFCTLVDNVSVSTNPVDPAPNGTDYWYVNPSATGIERLSDGHTIRTNFFVSPDYPGSFPGQDSRSEVGLHVFGDINSTKSQTFISFEEFAIQLGTQSTGSDQDSAFGRLQ